MTTEVNSGSQTATLNTEHTLHDITSPDGTYVLRVDTNNLVAGDVVILRAYVKVQSTGTLRLAYQAIYANAQVEPVKISIPVPGVNNVKFTLEQTDGTGRAFPWDVLKL